MTTKNIMRVSEVMDQQYLLVDGMVTVAEALVMLRERNARFLIVAKRSEDDELGIVLLADIARQVLAPNRPPDRTNVYEVMSKPVLFVQPDMDIRYCARFFHHFGVSVAPVIEDGEILGIVAYDQLVLNGLARQI